MKKLITQIIICATVAWSCQQNSSKTAEKDIDKAISKAEKTAPEEKKEVVPPPIKITKETAIDSVITNFPNGRKAKLYIYAYHDTIPEKPIKNFAIVDDNDSTLLAFSGEPYVFENVGPFSDKNEYLKITPCFKVTDSSNLKIVLKFYYNYELEAFRSLLTNPFTTVFKNNQVHNKFFHSFLSYELETSESKLFVKQTLLTELHNPKISDSDSLCNIYNSVMKNNRKPAPSECENIYYDMLIASFKENNSCSEEFINDFDNYFKEEFESYLIAFYYKHLFYSKYLNSSINYH